MLVSAEDLVPVHASNAEVVVHQNANVLRSVIIDVAGLACAVHFDRHDVAACFAARYADLEVTGISPARHAFAMHDPALGWLFWTSGGSACRWPYGDLAPYLVAFLADAFALTEFLREREDGIVSLHAATVGLPGGVAAIIGDSNVGKTTTAVACARAGMDLYSDERCLIDQRSMIYPFPRAINVRAAGLQLLVADEFRGNDPMGARLRAHRDADWNDIRISDLVPSQRALEPRPLRAAFLLAGAHTVPEFERTNATGAAKVSARWARGAGSGLERLARLVELFSDVPCFRLRLGTPAASAQAIRSSLEMHILDLNSTA